MKTFKSIKKAALFGGLLLVTTGLTAFIAVACSNSSNPAIAASTSLQFMDGTTSRKIIPNQNSVSVEPAVNFGGKDYTTAPSISGDFSTVDVNDQKAVAYFKNITSFSVWLQGYSLQIQNFLSSTPTLLPDINPGFDKLLDLACGLSAALNDGADTARLGLKSIDFTMDLRTSIDTNFTPYNATDDVGEKENKWLQTITGIELKYNWWTTNSANAVNWKPDNWDIENQNQSLWVNLPRKPKAAYSLGLQDLSFEWMQKSVKKDAIWIFDGLTSIADPTAAFKFATIASKQETQDVFTFLVEADKNRRGDVLNGSFYNFITSKDQATNLLNFIKTFK